ncbi:HAD family phosphatase [Allomuricauda sp. NBRC 101325]|uniref:HAD family hydrolase n=1 Tax=Allomuricauda sp. NBRC 101325 TaxID=1113758 RepID=UPI0024A37D20|nr:haloacid dehalogenase-like hydrolase [Muricauda sp. NBRC 101325]GLU45280.1 haloacid dehalogenase [Muricauda sp. NBRC 101325]
MNLKITLACFVSGVLMLSCKEGYTEKTIDPLPTFNEAKSKSEIIAFVSSVTDPSNPNFVEPKDRIVCFDNDGTLWAEQPLPSQIFFVFDKVKELAQTNPKFITESPYKEVLANDIEGILKVDKAKTIAMIGKVDSLYHTDYDTTVDSWLKNAKHPYLKRPYDKTIYQPMMELLDYLRENEFTIYIVSGGGTNFMRAWQPELYNIDKNYIVGSTFKTETVQQEDSIAVLPTSEFDFYDDHMGKVISIQKIIGKKPIMVVGNSDGDLEMMEFADTDNPHATLMVYVLHSDGEREFLYNEKTPMGRLEKGWEVAQRKGWTIIDMKKDWKEVFVE